MNSPVSLPVKSRPPSVASVSRPIVRTVADEGPAYGAALLAGVAAGLFENVDEACAGIKLRPDVCEPDPSRSRQYDDYYNVYRQLYGATVSGMHALSDLAKL